MLAVEGGSPPLADSNDPNVDVPPAFPVVFVVACPAPPAPTVTETGVVTVNTRRFTHPPEPPAPDAV